MIQYFMPQHVGSGKYKMLCEPFEKCAAYTQGPLFDLVFTGPPYFTYEQYTAAEGQSVQSFPDAVDWAVQFLFVMVMKRYVRDVWTVWEHVFAMSMGCVRGCFCACERVCTCACVFVCL